MIQSLYNNFVISRIFFFVSKEEDKPLLFDVIHHKSYAKRKIKSVSNMYEICVYDEKKRARKWRISILDFIF